jgi:hypothetical protein
MVVLEIDACPVFAAAKLMLPLSVPGPVAASFPTPAIPISPVQMPVVPKLLMLSWEPLLPP